MKSSEYWQNRFKAIEEMNNKDAKKTVDNVTPAFDKALAQIENKINAWYQRFADNEGITLAEAKRLLNTKELKEFKWDVQEYIKYGRENAMNQQWLKELENASARYHISRLEALKIHTQNAAEVAFGNELDQIDEMAARVYTNDYYHTAYEIQKGIGVGFDVGQIDQRKLNKIISKPWTADGQTFSDRIWKSKTQLVDSIHTELTQMCILGKAPDKAINVIARKMNVSKNQAGRLIMTEAAYFSSAAQKDCFNDLDVEKYEVVATLDSHTSDICQSMDGKVFDMKDFEAGVTAPPFHVWCRSCTVPWFEDNNDGSRAARDSEGKTYQVPASMKYEDWKKSFVDKVKDPTDWLKSTEQKRDIMSVGDLKKPKRPRKSDFDNEDEFYAAREKYKVDKEKYENTLDELVEKSLARPQRFQNKDEVLGWANDLGIEIEDGFFDEIDIRVFDDTAPVLEEMFEKYPFLKFYTFKNLDGRNVKSVFRIGIDSSGDALLSANGGLNFSPRLFSSYENGLRSALDGIAEEYFVRGDGSFETLLRHELGHNVDNYIRSVLNADVYDDLGRFVESGAKKIVAMQDELRKIASLSGVSEYAMTNMSELFAEGFAEYTSGGNSEFGKAFGEFLERWLH